MFVKSVQRVFIMANASLNELKIYNIKKILIDLLSNGQKTKLDLVFSCELSNTTVSDCINNLLKNDVVQVCGEGESIGGRKPAIYHLNREYGVFIGITQEIGGFSTVITNANNEVIECNHFQISNQKPSIVQLIDIIQGCFEKASDYKVLSVGIGLDGIVDFERGIVVTNEFLNWHNVHLKEQLERRFQRNVFIDNTINNLVLYEKILGKAKEIQNFMLLPYEYKEKIGIYLNGKILRGENYSVGMIKTENMTQEWLTDICDFLNLDLVVCTNPMPDGIQINSLKQKFERRENVFEFDSFPEHYAKSAALLAEIEWFESMNYILSGENKNY
jgi:hypothetical protein